MKTLVIHPDDESTDFLEEIYAELPRGETLVVRGNLKCLKQLIEEHDQVIMMGHGSPTGLFCETSYIIDTNLVETLRKKRNNIFIWCYAEKFVKFHKLTGLCSGMFISEVEEAEMFHIDTDQTSVNESNSLFARLLGKELKSNQSNLKDALLRIKYKYGELAQTNEIARYNNERLYFIENGTDIFEFSTEVNRPAELVSEPITEQENIIEETKEADINAKGMETSKGVSDNSQDAATSNANEIIRYNLRYEGNHMFVDLPEGCFLVDTGCPLSFGNTGTITFGPVTKPIPTYVGTFTMESLAGLPEVASRAKGLLGMSDLLSTRILWDSEAKTASLGAALAIDPHATRVDISVSLSFISFTAEIMGTRRRCLFDTGAQYGYIFDENLMNGAADAGLLEDYSPMQGRISCKSWKARVSINEKVEFEERFGLLTGMIPIILKQFGVEVVLGVSWMANRKVWFIPDQNAMYIL